MTYNAQCILARNDLFNRRQEGMEFIITNAVLNELAQYYFIFPNIIF